MTQLPDPALDTRSGLASQRAAIRRRRTRQQWRRTPAPLIVALVLHIGAALWLHQLLVAVDAPDVSLRLTASLQELAEPIEPEPEELEPEELELHELELEPTASTLDDDLTDAPDVLGLGGSGGGGRRGSRGLADVTGARTGDGLDAASGLLRDRIGELRRRGVEVAFVIDATGSMQSFIDRARAAIDAISGDLGRVVPGVRMAIVAYRDTGDDWTTRHVDFESHPWRVSNFLLELEASGGMRESPDFEEAVEAGLDVAVNQLTWSDGARRVILLVGDAPWHDEDNGEVMSLARAFSRGDESELHTVHVSAPDSGRPSKAALRAREAWSKLAKVGDGTAFELTLPRELPGGSTALGRYSLGVGDDEQALDPAVVALHRQVLDAAFGPQWRDEVRRFLSGGRQDARQVTVGRRVAREDRDWLKRQLLQKPLHPALIEGCRQLFDGQLASACLSVLLDESREEALRWAVLSVLRREIPGALPIPFDPRQPLSEQDQAVALLRRRVAELPGAERPAPPAGGRRPGLPPPPPGPAGD